jgi:hypothetical protein
MSVLKMILLRLVGPFALLGREAVVLSRVRRLTEPTWPHAGQEKLSQGRPAAILVPIVG